MICPCRRAASLLPSVEGAFRLLRRCVGAAAEDLLELALGVQFLDDVAAADQLAADEQLRRGRPARVRRQLLADAGIRQDVDGDELGATLEHTLGDAGRWVVRVIDHGTGLHAEEAERVFERFFRADESRVTATGGHGLGLAICRSIMRGHRGDVVYSPTPGGGATFEVRFDAAVPAVA